MNIPIDIQIGVQMVILQQTVMIMEHRRALGQEHVTVKRGRARGPRDRGISGQNPADHGDRSGRLAGGILLVAAEQEKIVANELILAKMFAKRVAGAVMDKVLFDQHARGAFVQINTLTAISGVFDVVNVITTNHGSRVDSKRVDSTEIGKTGANRQMMDVVVFNPIVARHIFTKTPHPADGNTGIGQIS